MLWIGSDGHLDGLKTTGTPRTASRPLSARPDLRSPAAVNNGAWHQAVLIPGQALYLDGPSVASGTASLTLPTGAYALLGTGLRAHPRAAAAFSSGTGVLQRVAGGPVRLPEPAAQRRHGRRAVRRRDPPGRRADLGHQPGRAHRAVGDLRHRQRPGGDRSPTPYGGTWNYGGAGRRSSSSAGYDSAVLANSPEDFWPLNDTAGPLATDMVGGAADRGQPAAARDVRQRDPRARRARPGSPTGPRPASAGPARRSASPAGTSPAPARSRSSCGSRPPGRGTLLSSGIRQSGGEPMTLWVPRDGCVEGTDRQHAAERAALRRPAPARVNDGKWHQAVLTLTPGATSSRALHPDRHPVRRRHGTRHRADHRAGHRLRRRVHRLSDRQRADRRLHRVDRRRVALHQPADPDQTSPRTTTRCTYQVGRARPPARRSRPR